MIFGAFGIGWKKQNYTAKSYVQNGLLVMWDGESNSAWGVHDSTATVWKNLAQDKWHLNVASETSWLDKCLHSTNTQYYMAGLIGNENAIPISELQTIEIVMSYKRNPNKYPRYATCFFFVSNAGGDYAGLRQIGESEYPNIVSQNKGSRRYINIDASEYIDDTIMQLRAIYPSGTGETIEFTKNSVSGNVKWATHNRDTSTGLFIGGTNITALTNRGSMNGDVYCIRIYNRALTTEEIATNNLIDKARFNITYGGGGYRWLTVSARFSLRPSYRQSSCWRVAA